MRKKEIIMKSRFDQRITRELDHPPRHETLQHESLYTHEVAAKKKMERKRKEKKKEGAERMKEE